MIDLLLLIDLIRKKFYQKLWCTFDILHVSYIGFVIDELYYHFIKMHNECLICLEEIYYSFSYGYSFHSSYLFFKFFSLPQVVQECLSY